MLQNLWRAQNQKLQEAAVYSEIHGASSCKGGKVKRYPTHHFLFCT